MRLATTFRGDRHRVDTKGIWITTTTTDGARRERGARCGPRRRRGMNASTTAAIVDDRAERGGEASTSDEGWGDDDARRDDPKSLVRGKKMVTTATARVVFDAKDETDGDETLVEQTMATGMTTTRRSSTAQAMANTVNILLGVGTLSVPFALAEAGWSGLGVLAVLGVATNYTGKILIKCQRRSACASYEDIGEAAFGRAGRGFITSVLYTELIGTAGLFFILEGDHLAKLLHMQGKEELLACAAALVMVPTTWMLNLSQLSYVGALGLAASVSVTGVMMYTAFSEFSTTGTLAHAADTALIHYATFPVSFGLLAFVFAGHAVFPSIYSSMSEPEEYDKMLDTSYAIVALNCLALGIAGYCLFGDDVADQVTLSLPPGQLATVAFALTTVNPLAKFALTLDPVAKGVDEKLNLDITAKAGDALTSRAFRTLLGLGSLGLAVKLPFFGVGMSLLGAVLTLTVSVVFPSACYLKMFDRDLSSSERALNYGIILMGVACILTGTAAAIDSASELVF